MRGSRGRERKRKKTLPCGQHCPSGIRDAHVVRKIILSLTKQEEGVGMEESYRSKQKVPQGVQSAGLKKKAKPTFCFFPLLSPLGSWLLPCTPSHHHHKEWDQGKSRRSV